MSEPTPSEDTPVRESIPLREVLPRIKQLLTIDAAPELPVHEDDQLKSYEVRQMAALRALCEFESFDIVRRLTIVFDDEVSGAMLISEEETETDKPQVSIITTWCEPAGMGDTHQVSLVTDKTIGELWSVLKRAVGHGLLGKLMESK